VGHRAGVVEPFERRVGEAAARGLVELRFRHRVDELTVSGGAVKGVAGKRLAPPASNAARPATGQRRATSRSRPRP
jgi:predicted oxidoreductase